MLSARERNEVAEIVRTELKRALGQAMPHPEVPPLQPLPTLTVLMLLDQTSSMVKAWDLTLSGFNEYLDTLRRRSEPLSMTVLKFSTVRREYLCQRAPLSQVPMLDRTNYVPNGNTDLYDAFGQLMSDHRNLRDVICVVQTDGEENSSKHWSQAAVQQQVRQLTEQGWTFVFLGADIDAWAQASLMGFGKGNTYSYTGAETRATFGAVGQSMNSMRGAASASGAYSQSADFATDMANTLKPKPKGKPAGNPTGTTGGK